VSPKSTDGLSQGSKNTFKGIWAEDIAKKYYLDLGLQWVTSRYKTPFAEVDLIFKDQNKILVLIEVKSLINQDYLGTRLGLNQKKRLGRAIQYFSEKGNLCRFELAVVSQQGRVQTFSDVFG
jgi:putative endonuclease